MKRKDKAWFALFTVPMLFIFTTVVIIPFIIGIVYSFYKWDGIPANPKIFVGFNNFVQIFQDDRFIASAWNTVKFTVFALIAVNLLGLVFSLIVTTKLREIGRAHV
jgi:raffinose/stachyose/melibiose transport system permease protein